MNNSDSYTDGETRLTFEVHRLWVTHAKLFNVSVAYISLVAAGFALACVWSDRWILRLALPVGWLLVCLALAKHLSDKYLSETVFLRGSNLSLPVGLKRKQVPIDSLESIGGNPLPFGEKHIVFLSYYWTTGHAIVPALMESPPNQKFDALSGNSDEE